jgi:pimeloyl-ACP methyl ester carboxylesterase
MHISENGTAYSLTGPEGAPVVALIHGLGLCRAIWDDVLPQFERHFRVLCYDFYGHGNSTPPPLKASLTVYSEQLVGLMDELDIEKCSIVGFSIGGMINRRFALDHPDRLQSLVILNSPHDRGVEAQKQVETRARLVADQGALSTMDAALKRWFTPAFLAQTPEVGETVKDWRLMADQATYPDACMVLAAGVVELTQPKTPVGVPTLIMTGENDTGSTPAMAYAIAAEINDAETIIVPTLQHLGLMEQPDLFTLPTIDFLNRTI